MALDDVLRHLCRHQARQAAEKLQPYELDHIWQDDAQTTRHAPLSRISMVCVAAVIFHDIVSDHIADFAVVVSTEASGLSIVTYAFDYLAC